MSKPPSNPNKISNFLPASVSTIRKIKLSFLGGCDALSVGDESRSNAKFAITGDRKWVIKAIKRSEARALQNFAGFSSDGAHKMTRSPHEYQEHFISSAHNHGTFIVPFYALDSENNVVVMPNFRKETEQVLLPLFPEGTRIHKYDVKPLQVKYSAERTDFISYLYVLGWAPSTDATLIGSGCHGHECWERMVSTLEFDLSLLGKGCIDYSLVFELAFAEGELSAEAAENLPKNCIASATEPTIKAMCVHIIDYLMEYSTVRMLESWWKGGKYDEYGSAVHELFTCVGNLHQPDCEPYKALANEERVRAHLHSIGWG